MSENGEVFSALSPVKSIQKSSQTGDRVEPEKL